MPRLRNKVTGAVVSVDDDLAGKLSRDWEPSDAPKAPAARRTRRKATESDSDD